MRNWNVQVTDNLSINVRSDKKEPATKLARAIRDLMNIHSFRLERSGIYGVTQWPDKERESLCMIIGERQQIPQPVLYKQDLDQFLSAIPDPVFDPVQVMQNAHNLLLKHVKVDDRRQTRQQADDENEKMKEIKRELEQRDRKKEEAFVGEWCLPEKVSVPEGMMAICLQITYDDSDAMSDYNAPHHTIGLPMLLAVVPPQPKTERLARSAIDGCPSLRKMSFKWKTENYSMGHGNYLISEWTGNKVKCRAYDGRKEVDTRFEVVFNTRKREYYPFKEYRNASGSPECTSCEAPAVMRINEAKDGVELRFPSGASAQAIRSMTGAGFRQNRFKTFWYAKRSEETLRTARHLSCQPEPTPPPEDTYRQAEDSPKESNKANMGTTEKAQREIAPAPPIIDWTPEQQMLFA